MADDYKLKVGLDANIYLQKATLEKELRMLQRDLKFAEKNLSIEIQAEVLADINKVKSQLKAIDSEVQKSASSW
ncbi:MAG: hypothetical protein LBU27_08855 [Candidatus Peribacteria bacterium]|jgi:hypothetical protein|nr:hypothetical protein [Candidatus Peribacteria bacterium]